jgi:hypothetical protein
MKHFLLLISLSTTWDPPAPCLGRSSKQFINWVLITDSVQSSFIVITVIAPYFMCYVHLQVFTYEIYISTHTGCYVFLTVYVRVPNWGGVTYICTRLERIVCVMTWVLSMLVVHMCSVGMGWEVLFGTFYN